MTLLQLKLELVQCTHCEQVEIVCQQLDDFAMRGPGKPREEFGSCTIGNTSYLLEDNCMSAYITEDNYLRLVPKFEMCFLWLVVVLLLFDWLHRKQR